MAGGNAKFFQWSQGTYRFAFKVVAIQKVHFFLKIDLRLLELGKANPYPEIEGFNAEYFQIP